MSNLEIFLEDGEIIIGIEDNSTDCVTYMIGKAGRGDNDRVFLDVPVKPTTPCVLTGGNPFKIETLHGFGRLTLADLRTGIIRDIFLETGVDVDIPVGVAYQYANCGGEDSQLILRDTSIDFDLANETTVEELKISLATDEAVYF